MTNEANPSRMNDPFAYIVGAAFLKGFALLLLRVALWCLLGAIVWMVVA